MPGGAAGRAAVLGAPVAHSLSPALHRAAYAALGLDWSYTAVECDEVRLPAMLTTVRSEPGWVGLSLTMPLKTVAPGLLDEVDELVGVLGAANTVVVRPGAGSDGGSGGRALLAGYNTDVDGVAFAVDEVLAGGLAGRVAGGLAGGPAGGVVPARPAVLGAGGTARAAIAALARGKAASVDLVARRPTAAKPLVALGEALGIEVRVRPWGSAGTDGGGVVPDGADLVIATTPVGATDALATRPWPPGRALVELLYHPWPTRLAAAALAAGAPVVGGLTVLAAQAVGQVRLFTGGGAVDVGILRAAGETALAARG